VENSYGRYYGIDPASFGVHGYIAARAQIGFKRCHV
jgi:hypothetical protein